MPLSTDVTLPAGTKPKFPAKCIVCHSQPNDTIRIAQNSANWFLCFFVPILMLFGWSRVELPICQTCKPRFRLQRWSREVITWTLIVIAVWLIMPHLSDWSWLIKNIVVGLLVLLAISPSIIGEVFWPRIFDTTAQGGKVDYEFADAGYAAEFHELNREHVIRSEVDFQPCEPEDEDATAKLAEAWHDQKSKLMEAVLGREHDMVMHAIIPYAVGGGLDLYYFPHGVPGTAIATKELSEMPGVGSKNDTFACYELAMFTKHPIDLDAAKSDDHPFGIAHRNINTILNFIAPYSAQATLNPRETCEFPQDMDRVGGKCLIFDAYGAVAHTSAGSFGILAVIEVFRSEMAYAREQGGEALLTLMKTAGHYPYSDLDRSPVA
jgi:hypothetical protein